MDSELFKSKKAKVVIALSTAILGAAMAGKVSFDIAVYCVTGLGVAYVIGQAVVDCIRPKDKE